MIMKELSESELQFIYDIFIEIKNKIDLPEVDEALDILIGVMDNE